MAPRQLASKQFQHRLHALRLSDADRIAISDKYPKTLLACLALQNAAVSRPLTPDELAEHARLERLVELRAGLDAAKERD